MKTTTSEMAIALPPSIPAPKFHLFQQVTLGKTPLTITGIEYCEPVRSLLEAMGQYGWSYRLSSVYGRSIESLIEKRSMSDNCSEEYWEPELVAAIAKEEVKS